jgi:hypothetical protein
MRLTIERSGGLVARKVHADLDGAQLTREQCRAVRDAYRAARRPRTTSGADAFSFKLVLSGRRGERSAHVGEADMPSLLTRLLPP